MVEIVLDCRDPEREIELVHRATAHPGYGDGPAVLADTDDHQLCHSFIRSGSAFAGGELRMTRP